MDHSLESSSAVLYCGSVCFPILDLVLSGKKGKMFTAMPVIASGEEYSKWQESITVNFINISLGEGKQR